MFVKYLKVLDLVSWGFGFVADVFVLNSRACSI